jgi:hypothetical protein
LDNLILRAFVAIFNCAGKSGLDHAATLLENSQVAVAIGRAADGDRPRPAKVTQSARRREFEFVLIHKIRI